MNAACCASTPELGFARDSNPPSVRRLRLNSSLSTRPNGRAWIPAVGILLHLLPLYMVDHSLLESADGTIGGKPRIRRK
jgi:hypothetical protein